MNRRIFSYLFSITLLFTAYSPACSQGLTQKDNSDKAFVLLNVKDFSETRQTIRDLESAGVRVMHVFPPRALICSVPNRLEPRVKSHQKVASLHRASLGVPGKLNPYYNAVNGITAWNSLISPPLLPSGTGSPLAGDAFLPQPYALQSGAGRSIYAGAPTAGQTSEFMIGAIAVGIILPESNGSAENWSADRQEAVISEIVTGCDWWAAVGGPQAHLTFYYDIHRSVPTHYEPILMSSNEDTAWVAETLTAIGYPGSDSWSQCRSYLNSLRSQLGTDWSFSIFVVDSLNDTDGKFPNGYFGYAYLGGPRVVMTYDNDGWGIGRMDLVTSHEMGHIFLAGDEYCSPGYACCDFGNYGYLSVYNGNCENGNPASISCMMKNNTHSLCGYTLEQIGWRDTDLDGLYDPEDTGVSVSINTTSAGPAFHFTGTAADVPYPSPYRNECSLNKITYVEYRTDGKPWQPVIPADRFDSSLESFSFSAGPFVEGSHIVEVQAINSVGNVGTISWQWTADATPPEPPASVTDDGDTTTNTRSLSARWTAGSDPESGIAEYSYAIGTSPADPGSGYLVGWTSSGLAQSVTRNGLQLKVGTTYYFYVKARNGNGLWSMNSTASNGIRLLLKRKPK